MIYVLTVLALVFYSSLVVYANDNIPKRNK